MNTPFKIEPELWEAIQRNYENESYSNAILDAMHLITETVREKTGLEGDGSQLMGQAFGGHDPKIQLNKLQTESEKNVQKGMQDLLRGLYMAIRNPRSHEKYSDSKKDADSIIHFIDYILRSINQSKVSFEESNFLKRVFDEHYVRKEEYSNLLVQEIPKRQRVNVAITVIRERKNGNIQDLSYFLNSLFEELEDSEIVQVYKVVSEELKYTSNEEDISTILGCTPTEHWGKVDKSVKIRIENMLLEDIKDGMIVKGQCASGHLGTFLRSGHLSQFENYEVWMRELMAIYVTGNESNKLYIKKYLWRSMMDANRHFIHQWLYIYFQEGLRNGDKNVIEDLEGEIMLDPQHPWWEKFKVELQQYPHIIPIDLHNFS